jgi:hypothetical protein
MTPLERMILFGAVVVPLGVVGPFFQAADEADRLTHIDGVWLIIGVLVIVGCSELRWWIRLFVIGLLAGLLQIGAAYLGAKLHALHTGYILSALITNSLDAVTSGRTDLPGFYREWSAAARSLVWRRLRWATYYVVSFVVIVAFTACTTYWAELLLQQVFPSPGIARTEDWLDASVLTMVAVFAILIIGRRLPNGVGRVRLIAPTLWAIAASAAVTAASQVQILYFNYKGLRHVWWQAEIDEVVADWAPGILSGLGAAAGQIIAGSVLLVPVFILVTALSDRAKAQGGRSRLAMVLRSVGLTVFCTFVAAVLGSLLFGTVIGSADGVRFGGMLGMAIGVIGSVGWLIWRHVSDGLRQRTEHQEFGPRYQTGLTELPPDVAAAVDVSRAASTPR